MTRTCALVHVCLRSGRWLLPWMSVLVVSAALAYAMNTAVTVSHATADRQLMVSAAPSAFANGDVGQPCTSLFGSYNWWLFNSGRHGPCQMEFDAAPVSPPDR